MQEQKQERKTINLSAKVKHELDSNLPKGITYSEFIMWLLLSHEEIFLEIKELVINSDFNGKLYQKSKTDRQNP